MSLEKPLWEIGEDDLHELIDGGVTEGRTIEYKLELGGRDRDRREFLADVSSFANTAGGHLLLGVREEGGEPRELCGLDVDDPDKLVQGLEERLYHGLDPRLPGHETRPIPLANGRHVVVIRIRPSLVGPHMVTYQNHGHFYGRHSHGKHALGVTELRQAFLRAADFGDRARSWRGQRLQGLFEGLPVQLRSDGPVVVLHIAPFAGFELGARVDVTALPGRRIFPLGHTVQSSRYNFDGLLTYADVDKTQRVRAYAQFHRDGFVESVNVVDVSDTAALPIAVIERDLIEATRAYLGSLYTFGVPPPAAVMVSLLRVGGYRVPRRDMSPQAAIDRDELWVPEVVIDRFDTWRDDLLQPIFDTIWNAGGHEACPHFDDSGNWHP